jgi:hypothetical protein
MSVSEIIRKQASAVKANTTKLEQAEQLEKMAAQLRAEATTPVKPFSFKEQAQEKHAKTERFGKALFASRLNPAIEKLTNAGFVRVMKNDEKGVQVFGNKSFPGHHITITGLTYSADFHQQVKITNAPVENIGDYIKSLK